MRLRLSHRMKPVVFMCVCMSWIALACHEDKYIIDQPTGNIGFRIVSDGETASRSVADSRIDIDGQELSLVWSVEENTGSLPVSEATESRGIPFGPYDDDKLITSIYTTAIYPEGTGGKLYFQDEEVSVIPGKDEQGNFEGSGTSGHFWPEESLSFFAYAFSDNPQSDNRQTIAPKFERKDSKCIGRFSYSLPAAATGDAPKKDASAQPDVVFAITPDWAKDYGPVKLVFHHALSAIVFKVGNMPSGINLESIAISGVYASGSCTMTGIVSEDEPLDISFEWACTDDQTFVYTESLEGVMPEIGIGTQMGGAEATFMMLPQTMSDDTKLVFTFSVGGKKYELEKSFKEVGVTEWKADHKYTFTIGLLDDIDVKVEDMVDGLVKNNLTIQNTGIVTGYIRAAIVGYWKNAEGVIEAPWSPDNGEGKFEKAADWGDHWKKGTDGFYYHLQPVGGNEFTAKLFEKYELNNVSEQNKDLILEISIVAQIIPEDQKSLWSELNSSN